MTLPMLCLGRRQQVAELVGVREQYLYQILRGLGIPSPALARKLNRVEPQLRLQDLRPDDWQDIWPELAQSDPNQAPAPAQQAPAAINSEALPTGQEVAHV